MRGLASIVIFLISVGYVKIAIANDSQLYYAEKNQIFQKKDLSSSVCGFAKPFIVMTCALWASTIKLFMAVTVALS